MNRKTILAIALLAATTCAAANASVMYWPLWWAVEGADVIVTGTVTEVRDERTYEVGSKTRGPLISGGLTEEDKVVSTISVLEVIKGDATLKTVKVHGGEPNCLGGARYPSTGQTGVWLLSKGIVDQSKPAATANTAEMIVRFTHYAGAIVPLVKLLAAGKKDDSVLELFGTSEDLDMKIVEYASSINLKSPAAIKTASRALASSYWSCRCAAANWLAATVMTPADANTALPALIEAANRTEEINKDGNASARAQAYEAICGILQRMGVSEVEKLPRKLEDSAKEIERTEAEAAIRRACDLAQQFLREADANPDLR